MPREHSEMMENKEKFAEPSEKFSYPKESTPENIQTHSVEDELYDVYKLISIAESLPEETVSVDVLVEKVFRETIWNDINGRMITPGEVYDVVEENMKKNRGVIHWGELQEEHPNLVYHFEKLSRVNYETPILLRGENIIVDGIHRVLRAYIDGVKEIKTKKFDELPESALLSRDLHV